ncbi:MAG: hypothetical protein EOP49_33355 [Sphingobacteriales bacterium]|nr:MAG: hypothetical protein EOP49_33355 [Sphingobacteriales bacterium]
MTNYFFIILFASSLTALNAQTTINPAKVTSGKLPSSIIYKGRLQEAWRWKDNLGTNFLVLSGTAIIAGENSDERAQQLFGYHYITQDTGYRLLWKLADGVEGCPVDVTAEFITTATRITDLDNDGIAETTLMYKLACRGDVSPAGMKLIMHEDSLKYALRGTMWMDMPVLDPDSDPGIPLTEKNIDLESLPGYQGAQEDFEKTYGRYKTEKEFLHAPPVFLEFARRHWLRNAKESFN